MKTVLYLRSSKDRADVSIAAQRRELTEYAKAQGWTIAGEQADAELSGSLDEVSRPGIRAVLADVKARKVECVLALDTSRVSRDPLFAAYVERECSKAGVQLKFKNMPVDASTPTGELTRTMFLAIDRLHSRLSAEKGRAGQIENVQAGFRAGGRAPAGYRLEHTNTGTIRGGKPVRKSKLVPDGRTAPVIKRYLKLRAKGEPRVLAIEKSGIKVSPASLIGIERNAWTYAGFTVWNRRQKVRPDREQPWQRMLPRAEAEWVRSPTPTHEALITPDEAEAILAIPVRRIRRSDIRGTALLSRLLFTPDGRPYALTDKGRGYRVGKGRRFNRKEIDNEVLFRIAEAAESKDFVTRAINEARAMAEQLDDSTPAALRTKLAALDGKIKRLVDAIADGGAGAALGRKVAELEAEKDKVAEQLSAAAEHEALKKALRAWQPRDVAAFFHFATVPQPKLDPEVLRQRVRSVVERVELRPDTGTLAVRFALPAGYTVASPTRFELVLSP